MLRTFDAAVRTYQEQAVIEAAGRFTRGEVEDQTTKRAPNVAEFCAECRKRETFIRIKDRNIKLPAPVATGGFDEEAYNARIENEMRGRDVLATGLTHIEHRQRAKTGEFPTGSQWRTNGTVYGPAPRKFNEQKTG